MTGLPQGDNAELHRVGLTENLWSKSIRKGPWRLVYYPPDMFASESPDRPVGELYNLDDDPWEMSNLYYEAAFQDRVQDLRAELLDWLVTTARAVSVHPPEWEPSRAGTVSQECVRSLCRRGLVTYL